MLFGNNEANGGNLSLSRTLPSGKRVFEHMIVQIADGKITRQVVVETWD